MRAFGIISINALDTSKTKRLFKVYSTKLIMKDCYGLENKKCKIISFNLNDINKVSIRVG